MPVPTAVSHAPSVSATSKSWGFFGPSKEDIEKAANGLRGSLATLGRADVTDAILPCLKGVEDLASGVFTRSATRVSVVKVFEHITAALNLLPCAARYPSTKAEMADKFAEALQLQKEIADKIGARLPDDSKYLHLRNIASAALWLIGVAAFVAINVLVPGSSFAIVALAALIPGTLTFVWGRFNDHLGTANHVDKRLKGLIDQIVEASKKIEGSEMFKAIAVIYDQQKSVNIENRNAIAENRNAIAELSTNQKNYAETDSQKVARLEAKAELQSAQLERQSAQLERLNAQMSQLIARLATQGSPHEERPAPPPPPTKFV